MNTPNVFEKYRDEIDAELKSALIGYALPLYDMMRYHLGWIDEKGNVAANASGKALRPTLCLLACEAVSGDYRPALPAAAAVELVHNYSLIHDDIQDDDIERRHRPTVWRVWGKAQAINAGTAMRILANQTLNRARNMGVPLEKLVLLQKCIDTATLRLIEGQYQDIDFEMRHDIGIDDYLEMIKGKTASLLSCSVETGARIGTDDDATISGLAEFGECLGIAFQIRDDILGIWGDTRETGKSRGNDILRKKKTLPIIIALTYGTSSQRDALIEILNKETVFTQDVEKVFDILNEVDVKARVQELVLEYSEKSADIINSIDISPRARNEFHSIMEFLTVRNH